MKLTSSFLAASSLSAAAKAAEAVSTVASVASIASACDTSTKGIVFFAGKCIYEKGLFWLLLILRGAFFGRIFPSLAPRSGAFFTQKKAASALQIAIFSVLLLRKMS